MSQTVPLQALPSDVQFPPELHGRILFHEDRQQLEFDGFMSKTDFDRLLRLSKDLAYQRALEKLFHSCSFRSAAEPEKKGVPWLAVAVAVATVVSIAIVGVKVW